MSASRPTTKNNPDWQTYWLNQYDIWHHCAKYINIPNLENMLNINKKLAIFKPMDITVLNGKPGSVGTTDLTAKQLYLLMILIELSEEKRLQEFPLKVLVPVRINANHWVIDEYEISEAQYKQYEELKKDEKLNELLLKKDFFQDGPTKAKNGHQNTLEEEKLLNFIIKAEFITHTSSPDPENFPHTYDPKHKHQADSICCGDWCTAYILNEAQKAGLLGDNAQNDPRLQILLKLINLDNAKTKDISLLIRNTTISIFYDPNPKEYLNENMALINTCLPALKNKEKELESKKESKEEKIESKEEKIDEISKDKIQKITNFNHNCAYAAVATFLFDRFCIPSEDTYIQDANDKFLKTFNTYYGWNLSPQQFIQYINTVNEEKGPHIKQTILAEALRWYFEGPSSFCKNRITRKYNLEGNPTDGGLIDDFHFHSMGKEFLFAPLILAKDTPPNNSFLDTTDPEDPEDIRWQKLDLFYKNLLYIYFDQAHYELIHLNATSENLESLNKGFKDINDVIGVDQDGNSKLNEGMKKEIEKLIGDINDLDSLSDDLTNLSEIKQKIKTYIGNTIHNQFPDAAKVETPSEEAKAEIPEVKAEASVAPAPAVEASASNSPKPAAAPPPAASGALPSEISAATPKPESAASPATEADSPSTKAKVEPASASKPAAVPLKIIKPSEEKLISNETKDETPSPSPSVRVAVPQPSKNWAEIYQEAEETKRTGYYAKEDQIGKTEKKVSYFDQVATWEKAKWNDDISKNLVPLGNFEITKSNDTEVQAGKILVTDELKEGQVRIGVARIRKDSKEIDFIFKQEIETQENVTKHKVQCFVNGKDKDKLSDKVLADWAVRTCLIAYERIPESLHSILPMKLKGMTDDQKNMIAAVCDLMGYKKPLDIHAKTEIEVNEKKIFNTFYQINSWINEKDSTAHKLLSEDKRTEITEKLKKKLKPAESKLAYLNLEGLSATKPEPRNTRRKSFSG